ncbi:hypothetical protein ED21_25973 [Erythrobacter sp. SD-21]|nr:hypothetical protein ED21_25973 [Erythrobacter sp. SD-21]
MAAGTQAGSTIRNDVSVTFEVGGVAQTAETDFDEFTVDRKVNLVVAEVGGADTSVSPGATEQAVTFQVTNSSNDTIDMALSLVQSASDDFDITNVQYYVDDGDGVFDSDDTLVTFLDEVAPDATITLHVVGDIPPGTSTNDEADVSLVATAHQAAGTAGALGAVLTATAGANTNEIDTVLADGAGDVDAANDGSFSDTDTFVVTAADVTVTKTSRIISDPVNSTTNPKAIPGAIIEYCIVVANAAGSATATNVNVNDELPADVSYSAGFGIFVDGDNTCASGTQGDASGTGVASYNSTDNEVDAALSDIAADEELSVYFRVTID